MGWNAYFEGAFVCGTQDWLDAALAAPRLKLPVPLEWPVAPPRSARVAASWLARKTRSRGDLKWVAHADGLTVKGSWGEDDFGGYFAVVLAVVGALAAHQGKGRLELVTVGGGDDFGRAIVVERGTVGLAPLDDEDETLARLTGAQLAIEQTPLLHAVLGVSHRDGERVQALLVQVARLDPRALLRRARAAAGDCAKLERALQGQAGALGALRAPWAYSAAGSGGLVSGVLELLARTAHDESWADRAALDQSLGALLSADAPFLRQTAASALAQSKHPKAYALLLDARSATRADDPSTRHALDLALARSRVPKRKRPEGSD